MALVMRQGAGRLVPKVLHESLEDSRKVLDKSAKAGRKTREAPKP